MFKSKKTRPKKFSISKLWLTKLKASSVPKPQPPLTRHIPTPAPSLPLNSSTYSHLDPIVSVHPLMFKKYPVVLKIVRKFILIELRYRMTKTKKLRKYL